MKPIDINPRALETMRDILSRHVLEREVRAFGSRVTWTAKDFSDLDLAVMGDQPLPTSVMADLEEAFRESDLPFKVDVVDWAVTSDGFRQIIETEYVVVQKGGGTGAGMAGEWRTVPLGSICRTFDGPHATPKKTEDGPLFLGISSLKGGRLSLDDAERLSEEDFQTWTRRVAPRPGDVVFSYETCIGEAAIIPDGLRCSLGRRMGLLRGLGDHVHPRFLLYAYLGPGFQETLRARTVHGSTVDRIGLVQMPTFPISVPPLPEQRAIAHILGALDDKIELNVA